MNETGDVGMSKTSKNGAFAPEPFRADAADQGGVRKLQRHEAVQARVFGFVDNTHAAMTELLDQSVVTDDFIQGSGKWIDRNIDGFSSGGVEELAPGLFMRDDEGFDFGTQFGISAAGAVQECRTLIWRQPQRLFQKLLGPLPSFAVCDRRFLEITHGEALLEISRCSQARAAVQSRCTVAGAIPMASEISSSERPAKKRSSTTRLCRGSILASAFRASSTARTSASFRCGRTAASSSEILHVPAPRFAAR